MLTGAADLMASFFFLPPGLSTFKPNMGAGAQEVTINRVIVWPRNVEQFIVCNRSNTACIMNAKGQVVKNFSNGKAEGADFNTLTVSPRGDFVYAVGEDKNMYCFNTTNGELVKTLPVSALRIGMVRGRVLCWWVWISREFPPWARSAQQPAASRLLIRGAYPRGLTPGLALQYADNRRASIPAASPVAVVHNLACANPRDPRRRGARGDRRKMRSHRVPLPAG